MRTSGLVLCLILGGCLASSSDAQVTVRADRRSVVIEYNVGLMMNPAVRRDLRLSAAQSKKVQDVMTHQGDKVFGSMSRKPKTAVEQRAAIQRMVVEYHKMEQIVTGSLTVAQRQRLRQLTLQNIGAEAAIHPKNAALLGLTPAQKDKLQRSFNEIARTKFSTRKANPTQQDYQAMFRLMAVKQKEAKIKADQVLGQVLNPSQKAKWKALLGKPLRL